MDLFTLTVQLTVDSWKSTVVSWKVNSLIVFLLTTIHIVGKMCANEEQPCVACSNFALCICTRKLLHKVRAGIFSIQNVKATQSSKKKSKMFGKKNSLGWNHNDNGRRANTFQFLFWVTKPIDLLLYLSFYFFFLKYIYKNKPNLHLQDAFANNIAAFFTSS